MDWLHTRGFPGDTLSHWIDIPTDDAYFLQDLSLELLFPESFGFITYQGSLSTPPCSETVTWILIDRALNITSLQVTSCVHAAPIPSTAFPGHYSLSIHPCFPVLLLRQMHSLRLLSQNPPSQIFQSLSGNGRPLQPLAHRALRGNRDPRHPERRCRGPNYRLHGTLNVCSSPPRLDTVCTYSQRSLCVTHPSVLFPSPHGTAWCSPPLFTA